MNEYFLILGSNFEKPFSSIDRALRELEKFCRVERKSSFYLSEPWGREGVSWFVNIGVMVSTNLDPASLLGSVKAIEKELGRRFSGTYLPRTVDIDLAAGNVSFESDYLRIPHPKLKERKFMLMPIAEMAPDFEVSNGKTAEELLAVCPDDSKVVKL